MEPSDAKLQFSKVGALDPLTCQWGGRGSLNPAASSGQSLDNSSRDFSQQSNFDFISPSHHLIDRNQSTVVTNKNVTRRSNSSTTTSRNKYSVTPFTDVYSDLLRDIGPVSPTQTCSETSWIVGDDIGLSAASAAATDPWSVPAYLSAVTEETKRLPVEARQNSAAYSTKSEIESYRRTEQQRQPMQSGEGSTLSVFTQNVLGHARDLQALASSWLNTGAAGSLGGAQQSWTTDSIKCDPLIANIAVDFAVEEDTSQNDKSLISVHTTSDAKLRQVNPFDPRYPLFGLIQDAWKNKFPENLGLKVLKCSACWLVYCILPSTLEWFPLLPNQKIKQCLVTSASSLPDSSKNNRKNFSKYIAGETVLGILNSVWAVWDLVPPIAGRLICTNFRIIFEPDIYRTSSRITLGTQWMHLCNYWEFPLGCIDKIGRVPLTARERSHLLSQIHLHENQSHVKPPPKRVDNESSHSDPSRRSRQIEGLCLEALTLLHSAVFPSSLSSLFTFVAAGNISHNETEDLLQLQKKIFNRKDQLQKFVDAGGGWLRISSANISYELCSTYPKLIVVPSMISDDNLARIAQFRSKQRIPILSWAHTTTKGTLWRSSQPRSMFNRCPEDETFLTILAESAASSRGYPATRSLPMLIIDARPLINAVVNKASGAGFENTSTHYKRCRIEFGNIENIHHVRSNWRKMAAAINMCTPSLTGMASLYSLSRKSCIQRLTLTPKTEVAPESSSPVNACPCCGSNFSWNGSSGLDLCVDPNEPLWCFSPPAPPLSAHSSSFAAVLHQMSLSFWYDALQCILRSSNMTVSRLYQGEPVFVHCSDGWDRTAQITSLAMLCVDPYYRTLEGFICLIEQEFLQAGHPFHKRCGHPGKTRLESRKIDEFSSEGNSIKPDDDEDSFDVEGSEATPQQPEGQQFSPVFLQVLPIYEKIVSNQWLDCVYQVVQQYPLEFQFSASLLDVIAGHLYTCHYGTFLLNSEQERDACQVREKTSSLWLAILRNRRTFTKPDFEQSNELLPPPLMPDVSAIRIWSSYWFRYRPNGLDHLAKNSMEDQP